MRIRRKIKRPRWTRSKTQSFGVALVILGAIQVNMGIFSAFFSESTVGYIGSGIGIVVFILRHYTTTSLDHKETGCSRYDDAEEENSRDIGPNSY